MWCGGMWSEQGVTIPSPAGAELTVERIDIGTYYAKILLYYSSSRHSTGGQMGWENYPFPSDGKYQRKPKENYKKIGHSLSVSLSLSLSLQRMTYFLVVFFRFSLMFSI